MIDANPCHFAIVVSSRLKPGGGPRNDTNDSICLHLTRYRLCSLLHDDWNYGCNDKCVLVRHLDLFSGIGGFALAARNVGWDTIGFCEIEPYCQQVLRKHWPDVPIYEDVKDVTAERLKADGIIGGATRETTNAGNPNSGRKPDESINAKASIMQSVDIITGGFPCQDLSQAGKQAGISGERSGLWSECARLLGDIRPRYAVFENVAALLSGERGEWFQQILWDISQVGYDAEWHCIPASHVGAPHRRDRVWIIAYPAGAINSKLQDEDRARTNRHASNNGERGIVADTECGSLQAQLSRQLTTVLREANQGRSANGLGAQDVSTRGQWATEPSILRVVDGVRTGLDGYLGRVATGVPNRIQRLKGLGNAIVPAVAEVIFRAIIESDHER